MTSTHGDGDGAPSAPLPSSPVDAPSGRRGRVPGGAPVLVAAIVGVLLVVAGVVVLVSGGDDSAPAGVAAPTCTPTPVADATAPPTGTVTLVVYNATDRAGLAGGAASELTARGFDVAAIANDPLSQSIDGTAVVRYAAGARTDARWVAAQVPGARLVRTTSAPTGTPGVEVALVLGDSYDALASPSAATAAYAESAPTSGC